MTLEYEEPRRKAKLAGVSDAGGVALADEEAEARGRDNGQLQGMNLLPARYHSRTREETFEKPDWASDEQEARAARQLLIIEGEVRAGSQS